MRQACYSPKPPEFSGDESPHFYACCFERGRKGFRVEARAPAALRVPMRLKLYCNRYAHFKDAIVCSVSCPYRTRCRDFAIFYDENRAGVDALVEDYFAARSGAPPEGERRTVQRLSNAAVRLRELIRLEVKREMQEAVYIWIGKDDQAELLELDEIIRRAERGAKAKNIYKVAQEMELRYQLVPRKRIEKAKRAVAAEAERAAARSSSRRGPRPVPAAEPQPAPLSAVAPTETVTPLPTRRRKAAGR